MCGEHAYVLYFPRTYTGSSPHVRGARVHACRVSVYGGIIPACAGSAMRDLLCFSSHGDHPRMCGEHFTVAAISSLNWGSSPHVRGAPF